MNGFFRLLNNIKAFDFNHYFFYGMLLLCISYGMFAFLHIPGWTLAVDELVFARQIYGYTTELPYQDFLPYKGVLGYYLLSIPFYFSHTLLDPLFYIKDEVALLNSIFIALSGYMAARSFDRRAVFLTLLLMICNQLFLIYAADLRVDMLASWCALFAALCVLQKRLCLAGLLLSIGFLISQKVFWYVVAINGAMTLCWMMFREPLYSWRSLLTFNLALLAPIVLYVGVWSYVSDFQTVWYSLFYEAYIQAGIDWYMDIYLTAWMFAFNHGPLLFFLWPLSFLSLFQSYSDKQKLMRRVFIISFASIALILFINYKQPFHYNFLFTIPAFFLLYADFISWLLLEKNPPRGTPSLRLIFALASYSFLIIALMQIFSLSSSNYLLALFPLITGLSLYSSATNRNTTLILLSILIGMGIFFPLHATLKASDSQNGHYQQAMIQLTADLLKEEGDYIAGVPYLYQKDQPIAGMKNLISPAIGYLSIPSEKLKPLLLSSLFITPTTPEKILADFEIAPVKVIIANYRIRALPPQLLNYIESNYQHFYGSIYIYAPLIPRTQLTFYLKFSGHYRLETKSKTKVRIDGNLIRNGQILSLTKGDHMTEANAAYQLVWVPTIKPSELDPAFLKDRWKE